MVYNSTSNKVYCANCDDNSLTVIDGATNAVIRTIAVGREPVELGYNSTNNKVYCGNRASGSVMIIDGARDSVIKTVAVAGYPGGFTYNPTHNKVYSIDGQNVTVLDGAGDTVVATVGIGSDVISLGYDPSHDKVYCVNSGSNVKVIDAAADTVTATVGVGSFPCAFAWNPFQNRVYVANRGSNTVSVIRDTTPVGIGESTEPQAVSDKLEASIIRGVLFLPTHLSPPSSLLSTDGRKVLNLHPGANDASGLAPGVYFVREGSGTRGQASGRTRKVVIQ
jgi:YVTN family beta-propeller protein